MRSQFLLFLLLHFYLPSYSQNDALVHQLLQRIAFQQTNSNNFPSYISNKQQFKTSQKDDNIFYAALINYTLTQQDLFFTTNNHLIIDSIQRKTSTLYSHFQNKNGRLSYKFWRTDTSFVFPYTWWIRLLKKNTSLPDDIDDTVLSLMAQNADSTRATEVHAVMQAYCNKNKKAKTIDKKYRSFNAYSVWYGKNFPAVYDVCVLSNILCFVQQYHLKWTAADSASLGVIVQSIMSNDYIKKPLLVSPYYGNTSLILYHVARLMGHGRIEQLEAIKTKLIITAAEQFSKANNLLEKIILCSALMKWDYVAPPIKLPENNELIRQIENSNFSFFTGNIPSYFSSFYKAVFYAKKWLLFYHYCPAFNDALLVEYLMLQQQIQQKPNTNRFTFALK